jgi:hypothetical protein
MLQRKGNPWSGLPQAIDNPGFLEVVRRHFKLNAITSRKTNKTLAHFSRYMGKHQMLIGQLYPEHGSGKYADYFAFG